jgi:hypothetical protein
MGKVTLYHATRFENLGSILEKGLVSKWEGVYLTDSRESAVRWMGWRFQAEGLKEMLIVEVKVNEKDLEDGIDHSPLMVKLFGVGKSLVHPEGITPDKITNLYKVEL